MPFSNDYANQILNFTFAKIDKVSAPSAVYIGLCSNDPEAAGGAFTELSGAGYERVLIHLRGEAYPGLMNDASGRMISNGRQINWNKATLDWATAHGFGLFTAPSGGTPFFYGKLEEPVTCVAGPVALFDPQTLRISFPTADVATAAATVSE